MGNIEIKQENNQQSEYISSAKSKRASIFDNNNKSFTPSKKPTHRDQNKLLSSHIYQQQNCYSPIRFSKAKSRVLNESQAALTEKKYNHSRSKTDRSQIYAKYSPAKTHKYKANNDFQESRCCNNSNLKYSNYIESRLTHNNKNLHSNHLNNTMTDRTSDIQYDIQEFKKSHQHGKIVPNSARKSNISYRQQSQNELHYVNQKQNYQSGIGQNREMIKKVRNFNDFLNEIKRKLKQESFQTLERKKSMKQNLRKSNQQNISHLHNKYGGLSKSSIQYLPNGVFQEQTFAMDYQQSNENQEQKQNKSRSRSKQSSGHHKLQIALKLQNQKLELQKYRKLVQRELSKNHSIENISLSTKKSGQKILTIQYENLQNPNQFKKKKTKIQKKQQILISDSNQNKQLNEKQLLKSQKQQGRQDDRLQELKIEYESIMKKMMKLGEIIETISKPKQNSSLKDTVIKNITKNEQLDQKKQKIENLFDKLAIIQTDCIQSERKVKQLIYSSTISDSSQSLY